MPSHLADPGGPDFHRREDEAAARHRVRHPHRGPHRGGDGSPHRGVRGRDHHLRHVQGGGPGHGHRRHPPAGEDRRQGGLRPPGRRRPAPARVAAAAGRGGPAARPAAGTVVAVNVSEAKGERKKAAPEVMLREEHGIEGDAHAGPWHRQVSLLAQESIDKMIAAGLDVGPGDFAENITTSGIEVAALPIGTMLDLGEALVRGHPDRQGVPHPLRHLLSGGRLRHAPRRHLRAGAPRRPGGRRRRRQGAGLGVRRRERASQAVVAHPGGGGHPQRQGQRRPARRRFRARCWWSCCEGMGAVVRDAIVIPDDQPTIERTLSNSPTAARSTWS